MADTADLNAEPIGDEVELDSEILQIFFPHSFADDCKNYAQKMLLNN